ncbi:hypothetical protein X975_14259, partial [Stegodyphus mimosarum]
MVAEKLAAKALNFKSQRRHKCLQVYSVIAACRHLKVL